MNLELKNVFSLFAIFYFHISGHGIVLIFCMSLNKIDLTCNRTLALTLSSKYAYSTLVLALWSRHMSKATKILINFHYKTTGHLQNRVPCWTGFLVTPSTCLYSKDHWQRPITARVVFNTLYERGWSIFGDYCSATLNLHLCLCRSFLIHLIYLRHLDVQHYNWFVILL